MATARPMPELAPVTSARCPTRTRWAICWAGGVSSAGSIADPVMGVGLLSCGQRQLAPRPAPGERPGAPVVPAKWGGIGACGKPDDGYVTDPGSAISPDTST